LFDFGAEPDKEHGLPAHGVSAFTERHFWQLLEHRKDSVAFNSDTAARLAVQGRLWGSNLAMLTNAIGTPYLPKIRNGILFVEDVNEHPFRVERMLYQLLNSGLLARQSALVLGEFNGYKLWPNDNGYDFAQMLKHFRTVCPVPVVTGLPFGHVRDKVTLPIGATATLTQVGKAATLAFSL
jgi:muramoyltetrapeptide carboxypeptidase